MENLPESDFVHRRIAPAEVRQLLDEARQNGMLLCVSQDDLHNPLASLLIRRRRIIWRCSRYAVTRHGDLAALILAFLDYRELLIRQHLSLDAIDSKLPGYAPWIGFLPVPLD